MHHLGSILCFILIQKHWNLTLESGWGNQLVINCLPTVSISCVARVSSDITRSFNVVASSRHDQNSFIFIEIYARIVEDFISVVKPVVRDWRAVVRLGVTAKFKLLVWLPYGSGCLHLNFCFCWKQKWVCMENLDDTHLLFHRRVNLTNYYTWLAPRDHHLYSDVHKVAV